MVLARMRGNNSKLPSASPLFDARALVTTIAWLRPCAVLGQALAVVAATAWLGMRLPLGPLASGIAVLALFVPLAFWRLRRARRVGEWEACAHLMFDMLLLGWALYFTGGASNPFITLLLASVAFAATALSTLPIVLVTVLAGVLYALLVFFNVPLPGIGPNANGLPLYLIGAAVNFLIAALLIAVFVGRTRALLNVQWAAARGLRERGLRDEGILAIATQAADAAHRFNTPLSTMLTLLPELRHGREGDVELCADIDLLHGEVQRCRNILRGMVEYGQHQLAGTTQTVELGDYVYASADRFRLLQPQAEVVAEVAPAARNLLLAVEPALAHALLNLMQNALDASRQNASQVVTLRADADHGHVEFVIGDRGPGLPDERLDFLPGVSSKPGGLGIGLSLAQATIERLHGDLRTRTGRSGTRITVRLPCAPTLRGAAA